MNFNFGCHQCRSTCPNDDVHRVCDPVSQSLAADDVQVADGHIRFIEHSCGNPFPQLVDRIGDTVLTSTATDPIVVGQLITTVGGVLASCILFTEDRENAVHELRDRYFDSTDHESFLEQLYFSPSECSRWSCR